MDIKQVPVDRDFTTLVICAVRYALQRRSYMPGYIVRYVTGILPVLPSETLRCLYRDIGDELGFFSSAEDEEFQTLWMSFRDTLRTTLQQRKDAL